MSVGKAFGRVLKVDTIENEFLRNGKTERRRYNVALVLNEDDVQRIVLGEKSKVKAGDEIDGMAIRPGSRWVGRRTVTCFYEAV